MTHLPYDQILRVMQEGGDPLSQLLKTVKPDTPLALKVVRAADDLENTEALMTLLKAGVVEALTPELVRELSKLVEPLLLEEANRKAATSWSTPSDDRDKKQWVLAEFGDAIAVNGDLVGDDQKIPTPPDDWEPSDIGGRVPVTEIEVSLDGIVRSMAKDLGLPKGVLTPVEDALGRALRSPSNLAYITVSGETEIYTPPPKDETPKASNGKRAKKAGKVIQVIREGDDPEIDAYAREVDLKHGMIDRWEERSKKGLCPWCGKKPGPGCQKAKCQDKLQKAGSTLIRKAEKAERRAKSRKKKRAK